MSIVTIGCSLIITMLLPKFMWVYVFPYLARKSFEGPQMMKGVNGHGTPRVGGGAPFIKNQKPCVF